MASLIVKPNIMSGCADDEAQLAKKLNTFAKEISNVQKQLDISLKSKEKINSQLSTLNKACIKHSLNVRKLSSVLSDAIQKYNHAESNINKDSLSVSKSSKAVEASDKNLFNKIINDDLKINGAVLSGAKTVSGSILGISSSGTAEGDLIGGSIKSKSNAKWNLKERDAGIEKSVEAEGHIATGKLKGNIGLLGGEISGTVGTVGASGTVGATLYKDGKLSPTLEAKLKAEAAVAKGSTEIKFGTDKNNVHIKGDGTLLGAEAEAGGSVGKITYKDETTGQTKTEIGAKGKVGAEAYLAQGTVSGGFTVFGIKIDAGVTGKAGAVGVSAEGILTTGGAKGKIGGALGLGGGIEISVDWSDFSLK